MHRHLLFTFLTCTVFLCLPFEPAQAQSRVSLGPMVGSVVSSFHGKHASNSGWKAGVLVGGFATYSRQQHNGITAEVYFIQKGARSRSAHPDSVNVQAINYIEIPVLFKYFLTIHPHLRPVFFGGPALSYRLNAVRYDNSSRVSNTKHLTGSDVGIMLGAGSNFKVYGRWLNIDLRYTLGITEVYAPTAPQAGRISNHVISSTLSMGWPTGRKK